jgi:glutaredoxin|mmetsp:Transcript_16671/g.2723  ORF Transcript_16671/g.2723 Transcript_16671/m.2723 type:complete len:86 (-) Transcript_16671:40-297(-)
MEIDGNPFIIYSNSCLKFCKKAKKLISSLKVDFCIIDLDYLKNESKVKRALYIKTKQRYLPYIFIDRRFIGGYKHLKELVNTNQI